jgi:predicted 2-oxoglutarate/Fe(II)-dependent dioxygenase YbiX
MSFKPEPGDLLCFPDNTNFIHGVKPIVKGTRFTLPRWFTRIV